MEEQVVVVVVEQVAEVVAEPVVVAVEGQAEVVVAVVKVLVAAAEVAVALVQVVEQHTVASALEVAQVKATLGH